MLRDDRGRRFTPRRRRAVRIALLGVAAAAVAVGVVVVATFPPTEVGFYPKCLLHSSTGLHCPGCGLTRATHSALNGRFEQAVAYNPLSFVIVPLMLVSFTRSVWQWAWDAPPHPSRSPAWVRYRLPWVAGGLLAAFWVLRNVPVYPLTLLAPHELTP